MSQPLLLRLLRYITTDTSGRIQVLHSLPRRKGERQGCTSRSKVGQRSMEDPVATREQEMKEWEPRESMSRTHRVGGVFHELTYMALRDTLFCASSYPTKNQQLFGSISMRPMLTTCRLYAKLKIKATVLASRRS